VKKGIEEIAKDDGRYDAAGLKFVFDGLGHTIQKIRQQEQAETSGEEPVPRHISGQELAEGLAELAVERWGRLARLVLNLWGISTTRDLGEIVWLMIRHEWMSAQPDDRIEDFDNLFDFEQRFEKEFDFTPKSLR